MEKRRRGLVRFVNALVKHPVLSQEQLVVMFLTVPTVSPIRSKLHQKLIISIRNLLCGGSRLPSQYKKSL